jgi:hypothetical protein
MSFVSALTLVSLCYVSQLASVGDDAPVNFCGEDVMSEGAASGECRAVDFLSVS